MDVGYIKELITQLAPLDYRGMYLNDFLLTWDKSDDELRRYLSGGRNPARPQTEQYLQPPLRQRSGHIPVPGPVYPHPLQLCQCLQLTGFGGAGPG